MTSSTRTIGSYLVERELARGGMGVVYLGRQPNLDRPVVLKKLRRDLAALPNLVERFHREARAASAVHHHNVVAVYDCFAWRGDHHIVQEFVDGLDLGTVLSRTRRIPPPVVLRIVLEALRGLEAIHAHGTVHRDLKPPNLLLGRRGEVKITDFGLALEPVGPTLTQPGVLLGTPPYMPPEQMLGERVDARGDLFSLGVLTYEMLAGAPPWSGSAEDTESLLAQIQRERYVPLRRRAPDTPRALARLVRACLRPKPKHRPPDATALRRALERRLRRHSSEECRAEIHRWLWSAGVFEPRVGETLALPVARGRRHGPGWRWAAVLLAALALGATVLVVRVERLPWPALGTASNEEPARLRVILERPMAVRVDEGPWLAEPPAQPIELAPGRHRVAVRGPEGEPLVTELSLRAGEERTWSPPLEPEPSLAPDSP